jgi:Holliday junction DNA helicase RuvA
VKTIQSVKRNRFQTAQRVILVYGIKFQVLEDPQISVLPSNRGREETLSALETLGYLQTGSERVDKVL